MPYQGLSDFLEELLASGELVRVATPVDLDLELAEITARVAASAGPALLFDGGFSAGGLSTGGFSAGGAGGAGQGGVVVANLLGTEARVCRALGVPSLAALVERMANVVRPGGGPSWLDRLRGAGDSPPQEKFRPKIVRQGACQQAVRLGRDVDLTSLPAPRCWPAESGRTLSGRLLTAAPVGESFSAGGVAIGLGGASGSSGGAIAQSGGAMGPGGDAVALRLVRGVVQGRKQLAFSAADLGSAWRRVSLSAPVPAALVLGGDPAGWLAAGIDWAPIDGHVLAGMMRNQPWDVVPARSQPLSVPADAEMVIEGLLGPAPLFAESQAAGAFSQEAASSDSARRETALKLADPASGHYRDAQAEPWLLEVTAITHRANPVLPVWIAGDTCSGRPCGETAMMQAVRSCLLRPALAAVIPELVDVALPLVGGPSAMAVLAIRKQDPGQARRAASALWGMAPLEATRWVIVVDADVDVHHAEEVLARVAANVSPGRDIFFRTGAGDGLDHAAPAGGLVERVGIDATAKLRGEHDRPWPARALRPRELCELVSRRWAEYGLPPPLKNNPPFG